MDGLFGQIEGWLRDFLKKAGSRIATIDEMEKVLRTYASRATQQRTHFVVVRWEPETKPLGRYIFAARIPNLQNLLFAAPTRKSTSGDSEYIARGSHFC